METLHLSLTLKHLATGIVTSPDYPANYPSGLAKPTTIQVEPGRVIRLQFTAFHTANCNDHLAIMDGDGTTLMEKACGASLPTSITSASNTINMLFKTDGSGSAEGWSASWVAVTPGESTMSRENDVCCLWFYVDKRSIIALCGYPLVKMEIRDSSQISTTASIFSQYDYFRQTIWRLASVQFHF